MKKLIERFLTIMVICLIMLLLGGSIALAEDTILKIGYLLASDVSVSKAGSNAEMSMEPSFGFALERALEINESFELGYGGGYQLSGEFGDYFYNNVHCFPLYLLLNYYPLSIEGLPYLTGHFGYNYMSYNSHDDASLHGVYYAVGAGIRIVKYPSIRAELLFTGNKGSGIVEDFWDDTKEEIEVSLSRISVNLGLGF